MVSFVLLLNRACLGVIGMPDTILNAKQVTQITGLSRTTIWRLERTEMFPKRLQISSSRVGLVQRGNQRLDGNVEGGETQFLR